MPARNQFPSLLPPRGTRWHFCSHLPTKWKWKAKADLSQQTKGLALHSETNGTCGEQSLIIITPTKLCLERTCPTSLFALSFIKQEQNSTTRFAIKRMQWNLHLKKKINVGLSFWHTSRHFAGVWGRKEQIDFSEVGASTPVHPVPTISTGRRGGE